MADTTTVNISLLLCDIDSDDSTHITQCIDALCSQTVLPYQLLYVSNKSLRNHNKSVSALKRKLPNGLKIADKQISNPSTLLTLVYALQQCKAKYLLAINHNCVLHKNCIQQLSDLSLRDDWSCLALNVGLKLDKDTPSWIEPWLRHSIQYAHPTISMYRCVIGMLYAKSTQLLSKNNEHNTVTAKNLFSNIAKGEMDVTVSKLPPLLSYRPSNADMLPYRIFDCAVSNGYAADIISNQLLREGVAKKSNPTNDAEAIAKTVDKMDAIIECMKEDILNIQQGSVRYDVVDPTTIEQLCSSYYQLGVALAHCYPPPHHISSIEQYTQYIPLAIPARYVNKIKRDTIIANRYQTPFIGLRIDKYVRYHLLRHQYISAIGLLLRIINKTLLMLSHIKRHR